MSEEEFFAALAELCLAEERRAPEVRIPPKESATDALVRVLIAGSLTRAMSTFFSSSIP
jgi:hypothetical protein